jgi:predicted DCC family thiol-disulfide oxidoreductase YuxK
MTSPDALPSPIVFYDGECGLCSRAVQWFLKRDHRSRLHFAPLQGETAAAVLPAQDDNPMSWSIILRDDQGVHDRSDAALRAVAHLGGLWRVAKVPLILPRVLRDSVYRFIARNRYRWFGTHESCWMGDADTRARFLP